MSTIIKIRRDTAANWETNNPVLEIGEPGLETDTRKVKYGNGVSTWNNLDYATTVFPTTIEHADLATSLEFGAANQIPYQVAEGDTGYIAAPGTNQVRYLQWSGSAFNWNQVQGSQLGGSSLASNITSSNLTSVGTLTGLDVNGDIAALNIEGTLTTGAQLGITSIGNLNDLTVVGLIEGTFGPGSGSQPNITEIGTLASLDVTGDISGTLTTVDQPNITSLGTLLNLTVTNTIVGSVSGSAANTPKANNLAGGNATTLYGAIPYQIELDTTSLLAPNTTLTRKFLSETGDGVNGLAPQWLALQSADIPNNAANTSGTATTATNLVGGDGAALVGAVPYQSNTNTTSLLAPNVTVTKKFLSQFGDGTNGAAPAWGTIGTGDVPTLNQDTTGTASKATNLKGGNSTTLLGAIGYQSDTDTTTLLGPNTAAIKKFLNMTGTGINGAVPSWDAVTATDVSLGNVTNESKATMFTSPAFTGTVTLPQGFNISAPLTFNTSNSLLTTAAAGAVEFDNTNFYLTSNTTNGRAYIPTTHMFQLLAAGTGITATATGTNYFGANSNIPLVANAGYEIEIVLWFTATTANARNFSLIYNGTVLGASYTYEMSPITGIVAPPGTATMLAGQTMLSTAATYTVTTGSLTTGANFYVKFGVKLFNGTSTSLKINAWTSSSGTITPQAGSYWKVTRIPYSTVGEVVA
jgi:hypothetical protein